LRQHAAEQGALNLGADKADTDQEFASGDHVGE
jgi:hypothetical protein